MDTKRQKMLDGQDELTEVLARNDIPCPNCNYSLRGLTGSHCPECDFEISWRTLQSGETWGESATLTVLGTVACVMMAIFGLLFAWSVWMMVSSRIVSLPIFSGLCVLGSAWVLWMLATRRRTLRRWMRGKPRARD